MDEARSHRLQQRELRRLDRHLDRVAMDERCSAVDRELSLLEHNDPPVHWLIHVLVWAFIIGSAYLSVLVCNQVIRMIWRFLT